MGFGVPALLPRPRWALTRKPARAGYRAILRLHAPFHPCQCGVGTHFGGLLSVPLRRRPLDRGRDGTSATPSDETRSFVPRWSPNKWTFRRLAAPGR